MDHGLRLPCTLERLRLDVTDPARVAYERGEVYLQDAEKQMLKAGSAASLALLLAFRTGTSQVTTARLEGIVHDPSGAVVQGARASVINTRTQTQMEALVNAQGLFVFLPLQPGAYTLSVEAPGFRKAVVSGLELNVGATVSETIRLELGAVTESLTVAANEVRVQAADARIARDGPRQQRILPTITSRR